MEPGRLGLLRNVLDPLERAPQMLDCLLICATAQGLRGSALVMENCPGKVACALEMLGELGRNRLRLARPCGVVLAVLLGLWELVTAKPNGTELVHDMPKALRLQSQFESLGLEVGPLDLQLNRCGPGRDAPGLPRYPS